MKMAAKEREIIGAVWGERERDLSNGSDGAGVAHLGALDGDGGKCLSFAHLGECGSTVCAIKEGMLRGDVNASEGNSETEKGGHDFEIAAAF